MTPASHDNRSSAELFGEFHPVYLAWFEALTVDERLAVLSVGVDAVARAALPGGHVSSLPSQRARTATVRLCRTIRALDDAAYYSGKANECARAADGQRDRNPVLAEVFDQMAFNDARRAVIATAEAIVARAALGPHL